VSDLEIGEDVFGLSIARALSGAFTVGATARYGRTAEVMAGDDVLELGAGAHLTIASRFEPGFGVSVRAEEEGAQWTAGADAQLPIAAEAWNVRLGYGAGAAPQYDGVSHRLAATGVWRDRFTISLGAALEPDGGDRTVLPVASGSLRLNRYALGVVREELPNDFGAIHTFRFQVTF
jgi:hypothetical protein